MRLAVPVTVRWSDLDAYGHVNNASLLTLLEEARVAAFWAGGPEGSGGAPDGEPASGDRAEDRPVPPQEGEEL